MRRLFIALLFLANSSTHAECDIERVVRQNIDGSYIRLTQEQCEERDKRSIRVELKDSSGSHYKTVLRRKQSAMVAPTGGGRLRDLDNDGVLEYEETGACGAGPNCEHSVFKINKSRTGTYAFFHGGYSDFIKLSKFYVTSGRTSCCSWSHHVYKKPSTERAISDRDFLYHVSVGDTSADDLPGTPCFISTRVRGNWVPLNTKNKNLLALCEVYGPDYILNPPRRTEEQ